MTEILHLSTFLHRPIFDSDGGRIGRVQDLVARLGDDASRKLGIAYEFGAEHRIALVVEINAGRRRFVQQHFRDHARGLIQSAPVLGVGREERKAVFKQKAFQGVVVAMELGSWNNLVPPR